MHTDLVNFCSLAVILLSRARDVDQGLDALAGEERDAVAHGIAHTSESTLHEPGEVPRLRHLEQV